MCSEKHKEAGEGRSKASSRGVVFRARVCIYLEMRTRQRTRQMTEQSVAGPEVQV